MKKLFLSLFAVFFLFANNLSAFNNTATSDTEDTYCTWDSWFKYPQQNKTYNEGKDIYVKLDCKKHQDIEYMELYVNGQFFRKESYYPYEWAKPNAGGDRKLRNMKPGTYHLKVKIKDRCGKFNYKECTFYVKGHGGNNGGGQNCYYNNPCNDLDWLKKLKYEHPKSKICEYKKNGKIYFRIISCHKDYYEWYDCYGKYVGKSGGNSRYSCEPTHNAQKIKCWYDGCGNNGGDCYVKCEFKTPYDNQEYYEGENVYVKVHTEKYQQVKYMELYVDGKLIRKENQYPYEWAKQNQGGDNYLRHLKPGKYKLHCKVYLKCGKNYDYYCWIVIKPKHNENNCYYDNPCNDLDWLKKLRYEHPKSKICEYKKNGKIYFRIISCHKDYYEWYDCYGKYVGKSGGNARYSCEPTHNAQKIKCWYDGCGNNGGDCYVKCEFKTPYDNQEYYEGENVYVKVHTEKYQQVKYMELYVDGKLIRKENQYPYEWAKQNQGGDNYLRHLKPGKYKLHCKVYLKCGKNYDYYCWIVIKPKHNENNCYYDNPCNDLDWLKKLRYEHPKSKICEYKKNGKIYFRIISCNKDYYEWYDCYGKYVGKSGGNARYSCEPTHNAQKIKCWYDGCGNNNNYCNYDYKFEYPTHNKHYRQGSDVYVKVKVSNHQKIKYVELYVNGKFMRKESYFPYEWAKQNQGGDHVLRNMRRGKYEITCKIYDQCGKYQKKSCTIYID